MPLFSPLGLLMGGGWGKGAKRPPLLNFSNHVAHPLSYPGNNLGLALGIALKFYTGVTKKLQLKIKKFLGLILTFVEVAGEKLIVTLVSFGLPS